MGWDYLPNGKPKIYNWDKTSSDPEYTSPEIYFTWQTSALWNKWEECLKYVSDYTEPVKIAKIGIGCCACDSGGKQYCGYSGGYKWLPAVTGYGAKYYCYIRIKNPGESSYSSSSKGYRTVSSIAGYSNMSSSGSPASRTTAVFGRECDLAAGLLEPHKEFQIEDSPVLQPGGEMRVHFSVTDFEGATTVAFELDPSKMDIVVEPENNPYVWQFNAAEQKWHLREPIYLFGKLAGQSTSRWNDIEGK